MQNIFKMSLLLDLFLIRACDVFSLTYGPKLKGGTKLVDYTCIAVRI